MNKYVLMTGAPGSKWSAVARSIYWSKDVDHTDYTEKRTYSMNGPAHTGAYWDPGMEFKTYDWDGPFSGDGVRLIKSHTFAHQLDHLKDPDYDFETPSYPIVMVYRNDYECMKWWLEAGGFDITYPNYKPYYKDEENMWKQIQLQNADIMKFIWKNKDRVIETLDNYHTADLVGISRYGIEEGFNYKRKDTKVYVYRPKIS